MLCSGIKHGSYHLLHRIHLWTRVPQLLSHAGDAAVAETTWHDEVKVRKAWVDVEGEAVHGDPAGYPHTESTNLVGAEPDTGGFFVAVGGDIEVGEGFDDPLLQPPHVAVQPQAERVEIENGIDDELPRPVVGDVAAAVGLVDLDAYFLECFHRSEQV